MNDHFMGALQAVVHDADHRGDGARLDLLPNPGALSPSAIAEGFDHGRAPRLAPPEIAQLARFAAEHGHHIARFQLVDHNFDLLPEPRQSTISDQLVERFRRDGLSGLALALEREFPGIYLNGLELFLAKGVHLDVRRRGVLFSNNIQAALTFMRDAWRELRLR